MKRYHTLFIFTLIVFFFTPIAYANSAIEFINGLKVHYQHTRSITAFSLTHSYLGQSNPYQSWDFTAPTRYKAFKVTEIDMNNQHYYQNVVHHYTGGLYFDEVHFQNDSESLRFEKNGISLGKRVLAQNMNSFERYKNLTLMNLDFFAVTPLLDEKDISQNITYAKTDNSVTITHTASEKSVIEYTFNIAPLRLEKIDNKTRNRIFLYDDYKHNNGFYFAHSLIKHYNGDTLPSFITKIESFDVIKAIDPDKLTLPDGFYRKATAKNKEFNITSIGSNIYLLTDESEYNNTLLTLNKEHITVFGVPRNAKLSRQVIAKVKQTFPNKSISKVYVTHPYSDHIAGLEPFVEQGATILADTYTISAIKEYPKFSQSIKQFEFKPISHTDVIEGVQFFVLENTRAKRQSFAYFKQDGIIFQTDFLEVAHDNTIAKLLPSYSHQFIQFIKHEKLNVNRIVGFHRNNNITQAVLEKSLNANTL